MNFRSKLICSTVLGASLVSVAMPAYAQDADAAGKGQIEEIVVTARKVGESLQSVPVSVTALSNATLAAKQVLEVTDLQRTAPSLTISTGGTGPSSIVYMAIRGQAQNSPNSVSDASVGIYIDGVYVARPMVGNLGLLDMASAEVLRGPQGTLFGRNTTGGALNLTTHQPVDKFEGYAKLGVGSYNQRAIEGMINIPLSDEVAVRLTGRYSKHDGYFNNPIVGYPQGDVAGEYIARAIVKWSPSAVPLEVTLSGDYADYKDHGNPTAVAAINPGSFTGVDGSMGRYINPEFIHNGTATAAQVADFEAHPSDWTTTFGAPQSGNPAIDNLHNTNRAKAVSATVNWDIGGAKLKSITAYRESKTQDSLDLHGLPSTSYPAALGPIGGAAQLYQSTPAAGRAALFNPGGPLASFVNGTTIPDATAAFNAYNATLLGLPAFSASSGFVSTYTQNQFSEELQLSGTVGKLDWMVGGMYFVEKGTEESDAWILGGLQKTKTLSSYRSQSTGVFAQLNYHVTDDFRITGGLRYTWDSRSIDRQSTNSWAVPLDQQVCTTDPAPHGNGADCHDPHSAKFNYPAWLLSADYRLNDQIFVYAKTSGASMSGGFNTRFVPAPYTFAFAPENVRDIEVGLKGDFFDRHLRTNLSVFMAKQDKVQRIVNALLPDGRLTQFNTNAGKVDAKGFEFEGTLIPWEGMELTGAVAYLKAEYKKGSRSEPQLYPDIIAGGTIGNSADIVFTAGRPTYAQGNLITVDRTGEPVTQAPKWTVNVGGTQTVPTSFGSVSVHLDYAWTADRAMDAFTTGDPTKAAQTVISNKASIIKAYGLLNGRVAVNIADPNIEIAVWGKNLLNQAWFTNVFNNYTGLGATEQYQGAPRTIGATATYRF